MIVYKPILGPIKGNGNWFTVNGAIGPDRDEAIAKAKKHDSIKSGMAEIKRVDELEVSEETWNRMV